MSKFIIKIKDRYFEWSTIVDSPVTVGMTYDELKTYVRAKYGEHGLDALALRAERIEKQGTSCEFHLTMEALIDGNRAGHDESVLTSEEIYQSYK